MTHGYSLGTRSKEEARRRPTPGVGTTMARGDMVLAFALFFLFFFVTFFSVLLENAAPRMMPAARPLEMRPQRVVVSGV